MALSQQQKVSLRRHLGVPFAGTAVAGRLFGWRFEIHVEDLEYRMNNMQAPEEQLLTGVSMGSFSFNGQPTAGDQLTFNVNDGTNNLTANYTVTAANVNPPANFINPGLGSPLYSVALSSAVAINAAVNSKGYSAVGVMPADLFATPITPPYFSQVIVSGPSSTTFTLTPTVTGTTVLTVGQQGVQCPVAASIVNPATGTTQVYYGYLSICDVLAMQPTRADLSLSYKKADVVDFRADEVLARKQLYEFYCQELSKVMGGKEYLDKFFGVGSGGAIA